ncbi:MULTISPECIES: hypothetical protein [unclassified Okeania]|nr:MULTISPECIES: hypothetical protein [unclassified Okeania]
MKDLTELKVPNILATCSRLNITQILKLLIPVNVVPPEEES